MKTNDKQKEIVDRIIERIESGVKPWEKPYFSCQKQNLSSGHIYKGGNWFILSMFSTDSFFLTFNQVKDLGGSVIKGAESLPVFFYSMIDEKEKKDGTIQPAYHCLKYFNVFGLSDCDIPEEKLNGLMAKRNLELKDNKKIDNIDQFLQATKADIKTGSGTPHYSINLDYIMLPPMSFYKSSEAYYHTAAHELIHWTGAANRLNRFKNDEEKAASDINNYALEELIAETGAAFITSEFGIQDEEREAAYLGGWINAMKNDYRVLFQTMKKSTEALDYIKKIVF